MKIKYTIVLLCTLMCTGAMAAPKTVRVDKQITIFNDVLRQLDINYVDTLNYEDLTEAAINQMLRRVDPYTIYYPKQKDEDLKMMTTGKYGGIGAIIQQREITNKKGDKETITIIANPYEGKPAQRNGCLAGDRILSVDGWDTKGHTVAEVSDHLRGVPGSAITLRLSREGVDKPIEKSFTRESIHMPPVDYYGVKDGVGYIGFGEFTEGSAAQFQNAVYDMVSKQGAKSLIIDLRNNGGGIVDEAVQILSNFVPRGTEVVSTRGKLEQNNRAYKTQSTPLFPDLPLIVMVNKNSASASEIVSGALQDLGRAKLIGQRTFGKGLVQNIRPIAYDGHLKVTTAKYFLPGGRCIQAIDYAERQRGKELKKDTAGGILPDIVLNDSGKVDICYALYTKNLFFDYATRYHRQHETIARPSEFTLTDADIEEFCQYLDEQKFTYETETGKYFKDLLKMAEEEDLDSITMVQLREFAPQINPPFRNAIQRNLEEVKEMLGAEIVQRYFYQRGRAEYMLRYDKEYLRAKEEISK